MNPNKEFAGLRTGTWIALVAMTLCASAGLAQSNTTATGYWKYVSYDVSPKPEEAPKPLPGRIHEQHAKGEVDIPGGKASIASGWKTDDVDRRPHAMEGSFGIAASQTLSALVPGTKVTLTGSANVTGNALAAALPGSGSFGAHVDNWDAFAINVVKIGQSGSEKGEFTVRGGAPGDKLVVWLSSHLSCLGAFGSKLSLSYEWQAGPPPQNLAAIPTLGGTGAASGTSATAGSGPASGAAVGPGSGNSATSTIGANEPASVTRMTLQAGKRTVQQGQSVTVPIWLLKAQSVANMNFDVRYDPSVAASTGAFSKGNLLDNSLFQANPKESGLVRVGFAQNADLSGDGTVVQLTFQANGAPGTRTPLTLEVTTVSGASGGKPTVELIHGEIVIVGKDGTIPGDSDGDNQITARDAGDALKMSVKLIPENKVCDMDRDGQVTSTDARLILAKASGK